ncbi:hypothetical protein Q5752_000448 [Cryptotrichosporon argae]
MASAQPFATNTDTPSDGPAIALERRPLHLHRPTGPQRPTPTRNAVGGSMVRSMKSGLRAQPETLWTKHRTRILLALAVVGLVVLNAVWLSKVEKKVEARGGWTRAGARMMGGPGAGLAVEL